MFSRSISETEACPIPISACASISRRTRIRAAAVSRFESSTPAASQPRSSTTAAANTGPAQGPRPTSSTPHTRTHPQAASSAKSAT